MLPPEERKRVFGGPEGVARVDAYLDALVAAAPPLSAGQKARLRALLAPPTGAEPASPAPRPRAATRQAA